MISFFVAGTPAPKGSRKAFPRKGKDGRLHVSTVESSAKVKPWMAKVALACQQHMEDNEIEKERGAVDVILRFYLDRPKSHFTASGKPSKAWKMYPTSKPDGDKLTRCVLDALTGIAWVDDSQVIGQNVRKLYANPNLGERSGVAVTVEIPL